MNCPKCSNENLSNAVFCKNCGTRIEDLTQSIRSDVITIGRAFDNNICINEPGISNKHSKIISENNQVYIEDLNSTNGTFVNGKKITRAELRINDTVNLGQTPLNLHETQIKNLFPSSGNSLARRTSIESGHSYQQVNSFQHQANPQFQSFPPQANQVNVIVNTPIAPKSVGTALLLTFFFGSFGMFYSTMIGGIVMSSINFLIFLLGLLTLGIAWFGFLLTHPICMIWAAIAATESNKGAQVSTQTNI